MAAKKPIVVKMYEGTFRKDRVKPTSGTGEVFEIEIPDILRDTAKKYFIRIAEYANDMSLLRGCDIFAMALMANDMDDYFKIEAIIEEEGFTTKDHNKATRLHPLLRHKKTLWDQIMSVSKLFGLTPISRAGLDIELKQKYETNKKASVR